MVCLCVNANSCCVITSLLAKLAVSPPLQSDDVSLAFSNKKICYCLKKSGKHWFGGVVMKSIIAGYHIEIVVWDKVQLSGQGGERNST